MSLLKSLFIGLLLLLVFIGAVFFALRNGVEVPLNLLFIELTEQSLAVWVLSSFVLGGLIGLLVSVGLYFSAKKSEFTTSQKLKRSQEELKKLRTAAYKS